MRLARVTVQNYKGIRLAEVGDLESEPIVAISGRNGTGKSLVLEAVASAWNERFFSTPALVGPWGNEARIVVEAVLTQAEAAAVAEFMGTGDPPVGPVRVRTDRTFTRQGGSTASDSPEMGTLRSEAFRRPHPFAILDFLPATRHVPAGQSATIDPELFGERRTQQERVNNLDNFLRSRAITQFPGVKSFLATMHYLDMLSERGGNPTNGYATITAAFQAATGKTIQEPDVDVELGASIRVTTRSGEQHDLDGLSSGEQEALALMYFVRRVDSRGGVLLIDEPEQHLHPALQASFFTTALDLAERAQLVIVTHSPKLLALAPASALLRIQDVADCHGNQASRAAEWPAKESLFADVGLTSVDLVQHDFIVVVEGETDEAWLSAVAPVAMSRASVVRAGGSRSVESMRDLLESAGQPLPWLCVRDRDFLTEEERADRNSRAGLYVLARRDIENLVLDPKLIARTFTRAGRETTTEEVAAVLAELAATQREEVLEHLVEARLATEVPIVKPGGGGRWEKAEARYRSLADANARRAEGFNIALENERARLDAIWGAEWPAVVDGKVLLRMLVERSPFHDVADLVAALQRTYLEEQAAAPADLAALVEQITSLATRT